MFKPLIIFTAILFSSTQALAQRCSDAKSNIEISSCLINIYNEKNSELTTINKDLLEQAQERDLYFKQSGMQNVDQEKASIASIQIFNEYREKECLRIRASYDYGSTASIAQISCKIKITEQRIKNLER